MEMPEEERTEERKKAKKTTTKQPLSSQNVAEKHTRSKLIVPRPVWLCRDVESVMKRCKH